MTQVFADDGDPVPVTVIQRAPASSSASARRQATATPRSCSASTRSRSRLANEAGARPLQEGERRQAAALRPRDPPRRRRRSTKYEVGQALAPHGRLQGRRRRSTSRARRKGKGYQGVMKRHHMPGITRDPRYARVLPPRRLDRLPPHPAARPQGQAHGGPDGQREEDRPEPASCSRSSPTRTSSSSSGSVPGARNDYVVVTKASRRRHASTSARAWARKRSSRRTRSRPRRRPPRVAAKPAASSRRRRSGDRALRSDSSSQAPTIAPHRHDRFHQKAQAAGLRSRARSSSSRRSTSSTSCFMRRATRVLDLGCAPGSWLQYAARRWSAERARSSGIDRTPLDTRRRRARASLVGDVFDGRRRGAARRARRRSTSCCPTWRPTRAACARSIRRARRRSSSARSRSPS